VYRKASCHNSLQIQIIIHIVFSYLSIFKLSIVSYSKWNQGEIEKRFQGRGNVTSFNYYSRIRDLVGIKYSIKVLLTA